MRNFGNTNENNESGWWNTISEGASDAFNYVTGEGIVEDVLYYTTPGEGFLDFSNEENSSNTNSNSSYYKKYTNTQTMDEYLTEQEAYNNSSNSSNSSTNNMVNVNTTVNTTANVPNTTNQPNSNTSSSGTPSRSSSSGSSSYAPITPPYSNTPRYQVFTPEKGAAAGVGILVGMAIGAALFR
jgi:hypothetical protein